MDRTMFSRLPAPEAALVAVVVGGRKVAVSAGWSVAAALLSAGFDRNREAPVSGAPRGPYCMMGACFECLVVIDGVPDQRACMTPVHAGMRIERQARDGAPLGEGS
jgi:predicted molibdopterin-dependent oxidoreductase YjgC